MTREKAAERLKVILEEATEDEYAVCYVTSDDAESLDMAIKALDQTDVTDINVGDMISRTQAIDAIGNVPDHNDGMVYEALSHAQRDVSLLPSVEPERKIGRWEWVQYDSNPNIGNWHCTECRNIVIKGVKKEKKGAVFPLYTHCPNCGAKMEVNG